MSALPSQSQIVVTDPRPNDYRGLTRLAGEHGWHVHFLTCGRAAIPFARPRAADLWMINVRLPEMSGFDLLEIVRGRVPGVPVFLVADRYDSEEERRACGCGAALYLCKDANRSIDCKGLLELLIADHRVERANEVPYPVISQAED
jgi:DNA-binding response OmpR family regulator